MGCIPQPTPWTPFCLPGLANDVCLLRGDAAICRALLYSGQ